ncbi:MAG: hypothetical protein RMJ97_08625, partial [Raineya sp.]|nr:hypothetical protein [Raineya sp.]
MNRFSITLLLVSFFVFCSKSYAQVVNGYARVTNIAGNQVTISTAAGEINETADTFDNGDLIIIMQMQDNVIGSTANDATFGNLGSIQSAGLYEIRQIVSQVSGPPRVLTLDAAPSNTYNLGANSSVQVITFRRFGSPNYTSTSNMSALAWNGNIGGVLAIDVPGIFTLAHNLSADGAGFRGGGNDVNNVAGCDAATYFSATGGDYAPKGEGIYRNTNPNYAAARGKILNGGGGGNTHNGGGGGGSNFSAGGTGGPGWGGSSTTPCSPGVGGIGGVGLNAHININRVFMGGGGGTGERNNNLTTNGGNGGGIIIIRAATLQTTGVCGTPLSITANGLAGASPTSDGAGGGGGGGSIIFIVDNWNVSPTCTINVRANGGNGGNVNHSAIHGGGGGGGQGVIFYTTPAPANVSNITSQGQGGCNRNPCDSRADDGENIGTNVFFNSSTPLPVDLLNFSAKAIAHRSAKIEWLIANTINVEKFILERSVDMLNWQPNYTQKYNRENYYTYVDDEIDNNLVYYRLKIIDK